MIGMAICCEPSLLIADEPTTALDVTIQRQILSLILQIRNEKSMGILFISHDLSVVQDISDRVSVIYAGRIVESATREIFFSQPLHPYSKLLLLSIPDRTRRGTRLKAIQGRVPNAEDLPSGCTFHPRCPLAKEICSTAEPELKVYGNYHTAACHFAGETWIS
jgi:oligopeptide/dipeptide ABC transporter ATP-binding protein